MSSFINLLFWSHVTSITSRAEKSVMSIAAPVVVAVGKKINFLKSIFFLVCVYNLSV